jgi:MFS family permease
MATTREKSSMTEIEVNAPRLAFSALQHADFRWYVSGATLSMMADNIEHVITYWVLWQTFHSPLLAGFAVVSHWLPFLLFSVYFGALADRYDSRRVIQVSQALFMCVSVCWGVLFLTGSLQVWHAVVLLILHGLAGAMWSPAEQLALHDIVGQKHLPSAVRLNATGRNIGILFGPAVGGALLLFAGPTFGIFLNALIYLPLSIIVHRIRLVHRPNEAPHATSLKGAWRALAVGSSNRVILLMTVVAGVTAAFVGNFQPQMPDFAADLSMGDPGFTYSALLMAMGAGSVLGGIFLEVVKFVKIDVRTAMISAFIWVLSVAGFAFTQSFAVALVLLFMSGVSRLAFGAIGQTIVQLQSPRELRGPLIGAFFMTQLGMQTVCGLTLGVFGSAFGLHTALTLGGLAAAALSLVALVFLRPDQSPPQRPRLQLEAVESQS